MTQNVTKWHKYDPKWPKNAQNGPRMTQNGPKMTCTSYAIFFDWKGGSANFFAFRMYDSERLQNIRCHKSIDYLNFSLQPGVNLKRVSRGNWLKLFGESGGELLWLTWVVLKLDKFEKWKHFDGKWKWKHFDGNILVSLLEETETYVELLNLKWNLDPFVEVSSNKTNLFQRFKIKTFPSAALSVVLDAIQ